MCAGRCSRRRGLAGAEPVEGPAGAQARRARAAFLASGDQRETHLCPIRPANPCYNSSHASGCPHAGGACRKRGVAMLLETLGALAALATIGSFVLDVAAALYRFVKRKKTRKRMMQRKEAGKRTSRNE